MHFRLVLRCVVLKVRGLLSLSIKVFAMLFYADAFFFIKL